VAAPADDHRPTELSIGIRNRLRVPDPRFESPEHHEASGSGCRPGSRSSARLFLGGSTTDTVDPAWPSTTRRPSSGSGALVRTAVGSVVASISRAARPIDVNNIKNNPDGDDKRTPARRVSR